MVYSKEIVREWLDEVAERAKDHPEWVDVFERCYTDTLDNTVEILEDGSTFVLTGDIPAMWLRDSTAQLRPYLHVAKRDALLRQTIAGLVKRQMTLVLKDPYANSFNIEENWKGYHETDHTDLNGWIWERKYEVDSLCYPLQLAYLLWKETGETSQFDETFVATTKEILHLWTVEQDHKNSPYRFVRTDLNGWIWERKYEVDSLCYPLQLAYLLWKETGETGQFDETFVAATKEILHLWTVEQDHKNSPYRFVRDTDRKEDTLVNDGFGPDFAVTGMTWSAFRPSDDCCQYSYLIPSNMFAVVVLGYVQEIFAALNLADSQSVIADAKRLQDEIQEGIENYAYTTNSKGEKIYAFEVDGLGNASIMDDPNVPSLLAAPYLGYCSVDDEVYQATRRTILSPENPYFYQGEYASGLGSSHTFYRYIWPIALSIQGLTTRDKAEKKFLLDQLVACDGGTGVMHESFHVDDPTLYSREWFSWANMMFCELVLDYLDIR
ncbi:TPA: glycoside hydrolase family 125 protein [Streptococcus pneumoniae]